MPADANANGDIFGGWVMSQMDLAAGIRAAERARGRVATIAVNTLIFKKPVKIGDTLCVYSTIDKVGRTSITLTCEVRNKITRKSILTVEKMVFVNLGEDGLPAPHGRTEIKYVKDQFQEDEPVTR